MSRPCWLRGRRVVGGEMHREQFLVGDLPRIVDDLDGLGMAGTSGRNRFVVGGFGGSAGITAGHVEHSVELPEHGLDAPEAAAGEDRLGPLRRDGWPAAAAPGIAAGADAGGAGSA